MNIDNLITSIFRSSQASGVGQPGLTAQLHVEVVGKDEQALVFYLAQDRNYNESGVLGMIIK